MNKNGYNKAQKDLETDVGPSLSESLGRVEIGEAVKDPAVVDVVGHVVAEAELRREAARHEGGTSEARKTVAR